MQHASQITPPWNLRLDGYFLQLEQDGELLVVTLTTDEPPSSWVHAFANWKLEISDSAQGTVDQSTMRISSADSKFCIESAAQLETLLKLPDDSARLQRIGEWSFGASSAPALTEPQRRRLEELEDETRRELSYTARGQRSNSKNITSAAENKAATVQIDEFESEPRTDGASRAMDVAATTGAESVAIEPEERRSAEIVSETDDSVTAPSHDALTHLEIPDAPALPDRDEKRPIAIEIRHSSASQVRIDECLRFAGLDSEQLPGGGEIRTIVHAGTPTQARGLLTLLESGSDAICSWAYTD